jgi:hypothetical protein
MVGVRFEFRVFFTVDGTLHSERVLVDGPRMDMVVGDYLGAVRDAVASQCKMRWGQDFVSLMTEDEAKSVFSEHVGSGTDLELDWSDLVPKRGRLPDWMP